MPSVYAFNTTDDVDAMRVALPHHNVRTYGNYVIVSPPLSVRTASRVCNFVAVELDRSTEAGLDMLMLREELASVRAQLARRRWCSCVII